MAGRGLDNWGMEPCEIIITGKVGRDYKRLHMGREKSFLLLYLELRALRS